MVRVNGLDFRQISVGGGHDGGGFYVQKQPPAALSNDTQAEQASRRVENYAALQKACGKDAGALHTGASLLEAQSRKFES
jgi:hypothetical protein